MNAKTLYQAISGVSEKEPISEFIGSLIRIQGELPSETFEDLLNFLYWYYRKDYSEDQVAKLFSAFEFTKNPEYKELSKEVLKGRVLEILAIYLGERAEDFAEKLLDLQLEKEIIAIPSLDTGAVLVLDKEKKLIYEVRLTKKGFKGAKIFEGYPIKVGIYYDPIQDEQSYELDLLITKPPYRQPIDGPFEKVLKNIEYYGTKGKKEAYLSVLFRELLRSGIAEEGIKRPPYGFVFDKSRGEIISTIQFSDKYDLKEALELLKKHGEEFYKGLYPQFLKAIVVELISPFSFLMRQLQLGVYVPYLFLWGDSETGKTSLLETAFYIYPSPDPPESRKKGPGQLHSAYQLGDYLGAGSSKLKMDDTLPFLINEGHSVLNNYLDTFKAYFESTTFRARYEKEIVGLRHPFFTSNYEPPFSQGLERRMLILYFGRPRFSQDERKKYAQEILPHLRIYEAIGKAFSERFIEILKKWINGEITLTQETLLETSFEILKGLYEEEGVELPSWLKKEFLYTIEEGRDWGQKLLDVLKETFLDFAGRYGDRRETIKDTLRNLAMNNVLPFVIYNPNSRVGGDSLLTSALYEYLAKRGFEHLSYERIASLLQEKGLNCEAVQVLWGYRKYRGIRFNLDELLDLLFPTEFNSEEDGGIGALDKTVLNEKIKAEILRLSKEYNMRPPKDFVETVLQNLKELGYWAVTKEDVMAVLMALFLEGKAEITREYVNIIGGIEE